MTKRLNEQVQRNAGRFPPDFMFQLSDEELEEGMWSQNATTSHRLEGSSPNRSQFATGPRNTRRDDHRPLAFTEHGCLMLANVLRSGRAVAVERQGGELAEHGAAIQVLLDEIRRLTRFPENPARGIGFTAEWPEDG